MKNLQYQQEAVADLTNKTIKALNSGAKRKKIVFEAPTGAGKTVMACQTLASLADELKNRGESRYQECAFIWFAPRKLHIQSYASLKNAFGETRKLKPVMFDELEQSEGIQPGEILFVNWESVNKDKNLMVRDNESSASLYEITRRTQEQLGLPIVAIIDEEHMFWSKTADKSGQVLERINPAVELRISATPKTAVNGTTQKVLVDRKDVINAGMIKKEVVLNPDIDVDASDPMSLEERLLKVALQKRQQIADEYERLGINIKPLLLVQLPNDTSDKMTDDDNKVAELVRTYLRMICDITTENGKLAVWLANEKENLEGLEQPDNLTQVLLFKEAIALGWDCPRAAVLLIFRKLSSDQFTIQTVGRILRMPQQKHYPSELLNIGYVYTDIAKDKIKIVAADQSYILNNTITAVRRENLRNVALPAMYASRPNTLHNYLGPDFKEVLYRTAEQFWKLESGASLFSIAELASLRGDNDEPQPLPETGDAMIDENRRRVQNSIRLDVKTVNVEIPKDVHFQNEEQLLNIQGEHAKFARTAGEIDRVFLTYINTKGGQFESRQGDRTNRIAGYLLGMMEEFFGVFDTDAKKIVLYHENKPKFDRLLDLALDAYLRKRENAKPSRNRILTEFTWEIPEERIYDGDTHHIQPDDRHHALFPFVELNHVSNPEVKFVEFLEKHSDKIDWWYKNGDSGKTHYAIPYDGEKGEPSLFYPDFVVRMKTGNVYIFDTKSISSDVFAAAKHNALHEYMQEQNKKGQKLKGGIIIQPNGKDYWLYCKLKISDTKDLRDWDIFDPNNA